VASGIVLLQSGDYIFSGLFGAEQFILTRLTSLSRLKDFGQDYSLGVGLIESLVPGVGDAARVRNLFHCCVLLRSVVVWYVYIIPYHQEFVNG
jgi:hypothetical protein